MTQITLSPGQVQQSDVGPTLVECRDAAGKLIGYLHVAGRMDRCKSPTIPRSSWRRTKVNRVFEDSMKS